MKNLRAYGDRPYEVAVLHGGPGALGEMAPVARELSSSGRGVLEPLQTALSLEGQVMELRIALEENGHLPFTLIGSSWGAWLGFLLAARYPSLVRKLILVGSGPFADEYTAHIMETRLSRLNEGERQEIRFLIQALDDPDIRDKNTSFARLGELMSKVDSYDTSTDAGEETEPQYQVYQGVWPEAAALRASGALLALAHRIECPVLAIHGDYDPHPAEGVRETLSRAVKDFRFILLERCGHHPWVERHASDRFYEILMKELR